jgi:hypothetical protein
MPSNASCIVCGKILYKSDIETELEKHRLSLKDIILNKELLSIPRARAIAKLPIVKEGKCPNCGSKISPLVYGSYQFDKMTKLIKGNKYLIKLYFLCKCSECLKLSLAVLNYTISKINQEPLIDNYNKKNRVEFEQEYINEEES